MAFRKIDPRIWNDEKFRTLGEQGKFFFLYLLTSPHSTPWGAYVLPDAYIQADLNFGAKTVKACWGELVQKGLVLRCEKTRLVALPNWFRYNPPTNEKSALACIRGILNLPKSSVLSEYCKVSGWLRKELANRKLTLRAEVEDEQEQEQKQEQEKEQEQKDTLCRAPREDLDGDRVSDLHGSNGKIPYREIVSHLNEKAGKNFRADSKETQGLIKARWNSGFRLEDFKRVIENKACRWRGDPKMNSFLRPQTLFGNKFEAYLNENPHEDPFDSWRKGRKGQT